MAATEAPTERLDVACGLENVPVSAWPPGAEPEPFQVGGGARPPRVRRAAEPAPFCSGGAVLCPRTARATTGVELAPGQVGGRRWMAARIRYAVPRPCSNSVDDSRIPSCVRILDLDFSYPVGELFRAGIALKYTGFSLVLLTLPIDLNKSDGIALFSPQTGRSKPGVS